MPLFWDENRLENPLGFSGSKSMKPGRVRKI